MSAFEGKRSEEESRKRHLKLHVHWTTPRTTEHNTTQATVSMATQTSSA